METSQASVSTAKSDVQPDDVNKTKEDQKSQTPSVETKEQGSESKQKSDNVNKMDKKETGHEEKMTSKDNETPTQIDVQSKSLSEVHDTKGNVDHASEDRKVVGDNDNKTKSEDACGIVKKAENPEIKTGLSTETKKEGSEEASEAAKKMESEATKEADKGVTEEHKDNQPEDLDSNMKKEKKDNVEKSSEVIGDKSGEEAAPSKDDGKGDIKNINPDDKEVSKDKGEAVGAGGATMETGESKGADNVMDVADDKENNSTAPASKDTEGTEHTKESKDESGKEPDANIAEPSVPKVPNGVATKSKGRRKGNPKRAILDDTPEPSTSTAETKVTKAQPAKKQSAQPPSKKRKTEEQRTQPTRRSKRRKFHGWGAKRKTNKTRNQ